MTALSGSMAGAGFAPYKSLAHVAAARFSCRAAALSDDARARAAQWGRAAGAGLIALEGHALTFDEADLEVVKELASQQAIDVLETGKADSHH